MKVINFIFLFLIIICISCSDDFDSTIKSENQAADHTANPATNEDNENEDNESGWINIGDITMPRAGASVVLDGDWLYIYGGETYLDIVLDDFWRYNLSTEKYEILSNSQIPEIERERAYATLVNLNGRLYLFGGIDSSGNTYDDKVMYYFDTLSGTWNGFNNVDTNGAWPAKRYHHIAVPVYNSDGLESIFFSGGMDSSEINVSGDIYEIDFTATPKYDWINYAVSHTRSGHSAVFYNESIYLFGGYDDGTYYNDLWKFDIKNPELSEITVTGTAITPGRSGISMIEHKGRFYVFGGTDGTGCLDDLWYYSEGSWTKISNAPFKRAFYSAVKYNDSLIVFGGYYINNSSQKVYSSEIWLYDLE